MCDLVHTLLWNLASFKMCWSKHRKVQENLWEFTNTFDVFFTVNQAIYRMVYIEHNQCCSLCKIAEMVS